MERDSKREIPFLWILVIIKVLKAKYELEILLE
jgi:hypothetical protein